MGSIGLQLYSVREDAEKDFLGTMQRVINLGYQGIQFAGFFDTPAEQVRSVLKENQTFVAGAHVGIQQLLEEELEETFEYHRTIENDLIICPYLPEEMRQTADDYKKIADQLNKIGEACQKAGFRFGYHNHNFEFERFGDSTGFELLFTHTDPQLVKMELDCYWASFADHDPLAIIREYKDRVVSLHIKDMKIESGRKTGTEVGTGQLDFKSLIQVGNEYGVEWFTVEQEEFERDPYESLEINVNNLKKMLSK